MVVIYQTMQENVLKLLPVLTIVYSKKENMDSDVVNFIRDFKNQ